MRRTRLAKELGFCFGVRRAVNIALKTRDDCYTLGPLIHNSNVIDDLEKKGIKSIKSLDSAKGKKTLIIRAHGITESTRKEAERRGFKIIDATCPYVKRVQFLAKKLSRQGFSVVVIGDNEHPEVKSIVNNDKKIIVIETEAEARNLQDAEKMALLAQTTQSRALFGKVERILKKKAKIMESFDTICDATAKRQEAAVRLARSSDLMIVIGDRKSANTKRLFELCSAITKTILVENADELSDLGQYNLIGITAGASTPKYVIDKVVRKVEKKDDYFQSKMRIYAAAVEKEMKRFFDVEMRSTKLKSHYSKLKEFCTRPGKRLRPVVVLASYGAFGKNPLDILPAAVAMELLHCSTLIHDDIMDEDSLRRGLPSMHELMKKGTRNRANCGKIFSDASTKYGVSSAICMGNILYALGMKALLSIKKKNIALALSEYEKAIKLVNEGQILDIGEKTKDLLYMYELKTGWLFSASASIGAILAGAPEKYTHYLREGMSLAAVAFQIRDDSLDGENTENEKLALDLVEKSKTFIRKANLRNETFFIELVDYFIRRTK
ncbi:4-hydroxy-3-methylbut-2-enyl diphosphate reductase [Candidatus Woesearchaeota archaeon]|nr:4-hydroxy-3-methylbut-2-enyl diphosphate reductase [Candidatus Woesearchaeota archaeon]